MSNLNIGANGTATVTVPAGGSVVVFSRSFAQVYQVVGYPNHPDTITLLGTVQSGQTTFGPYASGATLRIDAGSTGASYDVGTAPFIGVVSGQYQASPVALNATGSITAGSITGGLLTSTTAAAVAGTVPTGTVMDAASNLQTGDSVDWFVINTGPNTFTVTAASGHTLVGAAAVATATSAHLRTVKTAAATYITYRVS